MAEDETPQLQMCTTCGALLADSALHTKWHAGLADEIGRVIGKAFIGRSI